MENKMKKILLAFAWLFVFAIAAQAKVVKTVERGMTREQVEDVFGRPMTTSFDERGEVWNYIKSRGGLLNPYTVSVAVSFDTEGRVVKYDEKVVEQQPLPPSSASDAGTCRPMPTHRFDLRSFSEADFSVLSAKVKAASFDSNKLDLIQVASLGGYFTCRQCASLLSVFSFSDARMKALRFMAPHIVDAQNASEIYRLFTFSSEKDKAAEVIRSAEAQPF